MKFTVKIDRDKLDPEYDPKSVQCSSHNVGMYLAVCGVKTILGEESFLLVLYVVVAS